MAVRLSLQAAKRQWSFLTQALAWLLLSHSDAAFTYSRPAHGFLAVCAGCSGKGGEEGKSELR